MIADGWVPLLSSAKMRRLVGARESAAAWAAATPLPGTMIACISIRPFAGKCANSPCATQVADA